MKKVLVIVMCLLLFGCGKKKDIVTITLDINPSIEITVKKDKVETIKALNEDAKKVLDKELKGESLEETLKWIMYRSVDLNYIEGEQAIVLVMIDGNYEQEELRRLMANPLGERDKGIDMIVIDKVTEEDEKLAKENNISVAKAHYINQLVKERNVKAIDYINKSIREIKETKDTGNTCDIGYTLERDICIKEIGRENAIKGQVCPNGFTEYNGNCYEESNIIDTGDYSCFEGTLEGNKCIIESVVDAIPSKYNCSSGVLKKKSDIGIRTNGNESDDYICADTSNAQEPILRCLTNSGHIMIDGKCYNGPAPTINGGCPNGDTLRGGYCYSLDTYDQYVCPDGAIYHKSQNSVPEYCPDTINVSLPSVSEYKCEGNATLSGNNCIVKEIHDAESKRTCKSGFTLINNEKCINENNTKEKESGYICNKENTRLEEDMCIILDIKESNKGE